MLNAVSSDYKGIPVRKITRSALNWARTNSQYFFCNEIQAKDWHPNTVAFNGALQVISKIRIKEKSKKVANVVCDSQQQYEKTLIRAHNYLKSMSGESFSNGFGLPTTDYSMQDTNNVVFQAGDKNAGLEIVDLLLWIFKKHNENKGHFNHDFDFVVNKSNFGELNMNVSLSNALNSYL